MKLRILKHNSGEYTVEKSSGATRWDRISDIYHTAKPNAEEELRRYVLRKQTTLVLEIEEKDVTRKSSNSSGPSPKRTDSNSDAGAGD